MPGHHSVEDVILYPKEYSNGGNDVGFILLIIVVIFFIFVSCAIRKLDKGLKEEARLKKGGDE